MDRNVYENCKKFLKKFPRTIAWRVKAHASVVQSHIDEDEVVLYTFVGQKNSLWYEVFFTTIIVFTNKRMLLGRKRFLGQYYYSSITPDMLNDFEVRGNIIWGSVEIDTVKENFVISNLDKRALPEIEDALSKYLVDEKMKYLKRKTKEEK
ncbi:MAG: PH domain-containing protein [Bacilli bacterium]